jgi:spore coat polysaccharide biosynthesis protein SpsF
MSRTIAVIHACNHAHTLERLAFEPLHGTVSILEFQCRRLRDIAGVDELVIATSAQKTDDGIASIAKAEGIRVFRSEVNDTLSSLLEVADRTLADTVIYITPASPFTDPDVIAQSLVEHASSNSEFTALSDSALPDGFFAELVAIPVLKQLDVDNRLTGANRENIMAFIRDHTDEYRTHRVAIEIDVSPPNHGVAVTRTEDLEMLRAMHTTLRERDWPVDMPHVCKLLDEFSVLNSIIKGLAC